ncbi:MAG: peptide deformylase [Clostridia bacterium]|nr:peptide deformylase [Clostridia bacterium]
MAIRQIRFEGDEILKKKSKEIDIIDEKIKDLAKDMIETMYSFDGIGLAACQVGFLKRMIVYDIDYTKDEDSKKNPIILINPKIVKSSKEMITVEEGCLSFPDVFGNVDRHQKITVEALGINGEKLKITAKDMEAVVIQHELDHLDGVVFIDKAYDIYKYDPKEKASQDKKCKTVKKNSSKKKKKRA